mgnify:CR=1 FL=1
MNRSELSSCLNQLLEPARFKDYCPNGLQVEGRDEIRRVLCGVTASLALVEAAIERGVDAIVVHHGWFWRGEDPRVIATRKTRLARLLTHDINLFAYHLPLDAHPQLGNNAQLAKVLGWEIEGVAAEEPLVMLGRPLQPAPAGEIARSVAARLAREPLFIGDPRCEVRKLGWCSGGGQGYFAQAIDSGVDLFLSGEVSEQTTHLARESGVAFLAAGHHASERYGIKALAGWLAQLDGLQTEFLDIDNPV